MRSSRVAIERLTSNAKVATVLGSIPVSSNTEESKGRQMKIEKNPKVPLFKTQNNY